MAIDSTIAVRRAILTLLKNDVRTSGIVPATRWYPMVAPATPTWPFGLYGVSSPLPVRATCLDGSEIATSIHGFAKARLNSAGAMFETAEDHCGRLAAAIAAVLDGRRVELPNGYARIRWTGSQLLIDRDEADAFHCVVNLRVRCLTA
jgi:hypothetical protein